MRYLRSGWAGLAAVTLTAGLAGGLTAAPALADSTVMVGGACSLPAAIAYAEGKNGSNTSCGTKATGTTTIMLPAGAYAPVEIGPGGPGPIVITGVGTGLGGTVIDAQHNGRAFVVDAGATVTLQNLTLRNGLGTGGGIANAGSLELYHVLVTGNAAPAAGWFFGVIPPGNGGGIYNTGTLTVFASTVSGNSTGNGITHFHVLPACILAGNGGVPGGYGGGLYNQAGTVHVIDSTFTGNTTGNGGNGENGSNPSASCPGGGVGGGGAPGGDGGAIYNNDGLMTIIGSTITANTTGNGGNGGSGGNEDVLGGDGGGGGYGGDGAGIFNNGMLTVTNTTIAGNTTGNGGYGGSGGAPLGLNGIDGAGGPAAAIFQLNGQATVQETTIALNTAGHGTNVQDQRDPASGIVVYNGELTEINTITSHNDCYTWPTGQLRDGITAGDGHLNLSWESPGCPGLSSDPMLGPLQDNGGATQTMAIAPPSLAIGRIPPNLTAGCTAIDQRGFIRPSPKVGRCDIGAFEYEP